MNHINSYSQKRVYSRTLQQLIKKKECTIGLSQHKQFIVSIAATQHNLFICKLEITLAIENYSDDLNKFTFYNNIECRKEWVKYCIYRV